MCTFPHKTLTLTKGRYHNSKPVKVGKPSQGGGGGLGFYLVFPNLEVGKLFCEGGQTAKDNESFKKKLPP